MRQRQVSSAGTDIHRVFAEVDITRLPEAEVTLLYGDVGRSWRGVGGATSLSRRKKSFYIETGVRGQDATRTRTFSRVSIGVQTTGGSRVAFCHGCPPRTNLWTLTQHISRVFGFI